MKFKYFKLLFLILLSSTVIFFCCGIGGCTKPSPDPDKPFVRLLEDQVLQSKTLNYPIRYAVLLPEDYNKSKETYPVVYLLHGWDDNHTAWQRGGSIQYFADRYLAETGPMIFVMAQGFNTYYVNKFNGTFPYMNMFIHDFVPAIDSLFRTKKDKNQRAVMGYSMGGYGALILPALNPTVFSISVPLSMSFRTDEQYISQSQSSWDNQFGSVFGGVGSSGTQRLTPYFKAHSPFHFLSQSNLTSFSGLKIFLDCGDDEESLHITNGALHNLMRRQNIPHEYRVRNGGHSWNYWHASLPEALLFISKAFKGESFPSDPIEANIGNSINGEQYQLCSIPGSNKLLGVYKPSNYSTTTDSLPVIFIIHDFQGTQRQEKATKVISLLNNKMASGIIPHAVIFEIPIDSENITTNLFQTIINQVKNNYRVTSDHRRRILIGNENGGGTAATLIPNFKQAFNACFLFNANLPVTSLVTSGIFYYIDVTDKSVSYQENFDFFILTRSNNIQHEYRIRQGTQNYQAFINGLDQSLAFISNRLKI